MNACPAGWDAAIPHALGADAPRKAHQVMQAFTISVVLMSGACGTGAYETGVRDSAPACNEVQSFAATQGFCAIENSLRPAFDAIDFVIRQVVQNDRESN